MSIKVIYLCYVWSTNTRSKKGIKQKTTVETNLFALAILISYKKKLSNYGELQTAVRGRIRAKLKTIIY